MKITINGQAVDYELKGETQVSHIVDGVRAFLETQGYVPKSWQLQGRELTPEDLKAPIPAQGDLSVEAVSSLEEQLGNLQLTADFFVLLRQGILEDNQQVLKELSQDYPSLFSALDSILGLGFHKGFSLFAQDIRSRCAQFTETGSSEVFRGMDQVIQTFLLEMDTMARGLQNPQDLWGSLCRTTSELAAELPQVSLLLSTGKDKAALDIILTLVNHLESSTYFMEMLRRFRLDFFSEISASVEALSQMNPFMKDISDAMDRKDYVLVGDLLEYEIAPLLSRLSPGAL